MDIKDFIPPDFVPHLANCFQERQPFDVADGAADFYDYHVGVGAGGQSGEAVFDFVGEMGNGLDSAAEEIAAPLAGNQRQVGLAGGNIAVAGQFHIDEPLVVAQIQVGFAAVAGNENLAVLVGGHRAGIHIEIGIQFDDGNGQPLAFEDASDRGDADPLADRADHAPGYKDKLGGHSIRIPRAPARRRAGAAIPSGSHWQREWV